MAEKQQLVNRALVALYLLGIFYLIVVGIYAVIAWVIAIILLINLVYYLKTGNLRTVWISVGSFVLIVFLSWFTPILNANVTEIGCLDFCFDGAIVDLLIKISSVIMLLFSGLATLTFRKA